MGATADTRALAAAIPFLWKRRKIKIMNYVLIITTLALALVALFKDSFPQRFRLGVTVVTSVLLVLSAVVHIYLERSTAQKEWQAKWSGRLRSRLKSKEKFPLLTLGQSRLVWQGDPNMPMSNLAGGADIAS